MWHGALGAYFINAVCYFPVALIGYWTFGQAVDDNVLMELERPAWLIASANLMATTYLPTIIFGTYISWIYLRYWQRKPETKHRGDLSEDFAFSTFSPEFLRLVIDPIASIFHRMLNGRYDASNDGQGNNMESEPLPGSDSIEASRRR
ncbi:hypothetical protein JHK87_001454 [Glycine soja]|nr:hypothetical protein JHK87_001454 [Glycine soja]